MNDKKVKKWEWDTDKISLVLTWRWRRYPKYWHGDETYIIIIVNGHSYGYR